MAKCVKVLKVVKGGALPFGEYEGVWGGYEVKLTIDGVEYVLFLDEGIRTPAAPCVVSVRADGITVKVKERKR